MILNENYGLPIYQRVIIMIQNETKLPTKKYHSLWCRLKTLWSIRWRLNCHSNKRLQMPTLYSTYKVSRSIRCILAFAFVCVFFVFFFSCAITWLPNFNFLVRNRQFNLLCSEQNQYFSIKLVTRQRVCLFLLTPANIRLSILSNAGFLLVP